MPEVLKAVVRANDNHAGIYSYGHSHRSTGGLDRRYSCARRSGKSSAPETTTRVGALTSPYHSRES